VLIRKKISILFSIYSLLHGKKNKIQVLLNHIGFVLCLIRLIDNPTNCLFFLCFSRNFINQTHFYNIVYLKKVLPC